MRRTSGQLMASSISASTSNFFLRTEHALNVRRQRRKFARPDWVQHTLALTPMPETVGPSLCKSWPDQPEGYFERSGDCLWGLRNAVALRQRESPVHVT